jgi:xylitol oxidase
MFAYAADANTGLTTADSTCDVRPLPDRAPGSLDRMTATGPELTNWSGSHRYRARTVHHPDSLDALRRLLVEATGTLQVIATRHTFTAIGDADELIALDRLPGAETIDIDRVAMTATVGPAVSYAQLAEALNREGLALENLASLPHISVAGAVATATHGSGLALRNLATAVTAIELVTTDGERLRIDRADARLPGAVVHLGALGVVTRVTLTVIPYYELRQDVWLGLEWDVLQEHFTEIMGAGRSVSVFHDFGEHARELWVKRDPAQPLPAQTGSGELFGARPAHEPHNPVPGGLPANCTAQLGRPGPWSERLPHFRSGFTPSAGQEIQSEFFVAREHGMTALRALLGLAPQIQPVLQIAELRVIAGDELWMSPQHGRDTAALHFTWRLDPEPVAAACAEVERALAPLDVRPHWGKLFTAAPQRHRPERLADFLALRQQLDPRDVLANPWLREQVLAAHDN